MVALVESLHYVFASNLWVKVGEFVKSSNGNLCEDLSRCADGDKMRFLDELISRY
jgi:hypothetical protein